MKIQADTIVTLVMFILTLVITHNVILAAVFAAGFAFGMDTIATRRAKMAAIEEARKLDNSKSQDVSFT
jgi:type III secretory pathway component EscU